MKQFFRFLVPMTALAALLVVAPSCGGDDGDDGGTTTTCDPECDANACQTCVEGACVSTCAEGETCDGAGTCVAGATDECDPACDATMCMTCVEGECVSSCKDGEECVDGACQVPGGDECEPACDATMCMVCTDGECVSSCTGDEECVDGTCQVPTVECEPACVADDCMECVDGACVSTCTGDEVCDGAGTCAVPACDPACDADACQVCEGTECVSACADDEECDGAGTCVPACDPACDANACMVCVEGEPNECVSTCDANECMECDGAGGCVSTCTGDEICMNGTCSAPMACGNPNAAGYCDASIVSELAIANAPTDTDPGCCCDFTGDGVMDNKIAELIANVGPMAGLDLAGVNAMIAEQLAAGTFGVVFEYIGLAAGAADTDYLDVNFFLAGDADDDPTNNFSGDADMAIMPESLDTDGNPLITFEGASVAGGVLTGGPSRFIIPISIPEPPLDLVLTLDGIQMTADIAAGATMGYELSAGTLCGYITGEELFNALNQFVETSCGCLNIDGEYVFMNDEGAYACATPTTAPTCNADDDIENACSMINQYCLTAVGLVPMFFDVDLDGDPTQGEAISVGATFGATSVNITGVLSAD